MLLLTRQFPVLDSVGCIGCRAEAAFPIDFVVLVVALEPHDAAVALEREHVRGNPVQKPTVVADHNGAPGVVHQGLLERAQRIDVKVVRGLVQKQQVRSALEQLGQVNAVAFTAGERSDLSLLLPALEVEPGHVGARWHRALANLELIQSAGNLFEHALVGAQRVAALIHVPDLHRLSEAKRALVRFLLARDHPE